MNQSKMVLFGTMANPQPSADNLSTGQTDLLVQYVIKPHAILGERKQLTLPRYVPILDAKNPPRYVVFFDIVEGKLNPFMGRPAESAEIVDYLRRSEMLHGKSPSECLRFYFPYLSSKDRVVADDAFLEFAKASDEEIGKVAATLDPEPIRKLLKDPGTSPDHRSLLAFLLGCCGTDADGQWIRSVILDPQATITDNALDGFLSGYVQRDPQQAWKLIHAIISDKKRPTTVRFSAFYVVRFYHNWQPKTYRKEIVATLSVALSDPELADLAIDSLRRYSIWDLTDQVLALYNNPDFAAPIYRRSVIRYALYCEDDVDSAKVFLNQLRRTDPNLVMELRELMQIEKQISGKF